MTDRKERAALIRLDIKAAVNAGSLPDLRWTVVCRGTWRDPEIAVGIREMRNTQGMSMNASLEALDVALGKITDSHRTVMGKILRQHVRRCDRLNLHPSKLWRCINVLPDQVLGITPTHERQEEYGIEPT